MIVGILGGGQLGRMLALAGYPLGIRCRCLDPSGDSPAAQVAPLIQGGWHDTLHLERLATEAVAITYEFENVPADALAYLQGRIPLRPDPIALAVAQERAREKDFLRDLGVPVPDYHAVDSLEELRDALEMIGCPAVLKTRRYGYDGKGQAVLREPADAAVAWRAVGGQPSLLESFVPFEREVSLVAVRDLHGTFSAWPLVENHHRGGILRLSLAPASGITAELQQQAEVHVRRCMDALNYVGVLTMEFFQLGGKLLANEFAPRVHNSGHWTIEGSTTSQFENHLRAVADLPLGPTDAIGFSAMINLIGSAPPHANILSLPGAHLHWYGKEPRPGRKIGHVTLCDDDPERLERRLRSALELIDSSLVPLAGRAKGVSVS